MRAGFNARQSTCWQRLKVGLCRQTTSLPPASSATGRAISRSGHYHLQSTRDGCFADWSWENGTGYFSRPQRSETLKADVAKSSLNDRLVRIANERKHLGRVANLASGRKSVAIAFRGGQLSSLWAAQFPAALSGFTCGSMKLDHCCLCSSRLSNRHLMRCFLGEGLSS